MGSLKEGFAALQMELAASLPEEANKLLKQATQRLVDGALINLLITVGDKFPQFSLPNVVGNAINSEDLLGQGPLVVSFYRGGWCPYCNLELRAYQAVLDDIHTLGAELVAISPQLPDESMTMVAKANLTFEVLSDTGNSLAEHLGLVFEVTDKVADLYRSMGYDLERINGNVHWTLPVPATFVIGMDNTVVRAYSHADHTRRLEPAEALDSLRGLRNSARTRCW
ncbi:MAG: peroxiredoxin-like family protein [Gammaproteobacteria bacterium]|nr:peroxiredoxin-like family protein [Gammaproteobacteria bacterium]